MLKSFLMNFRSLAFERAFYYEIDGSKNLDLAIAIAHDKSRFYFLPG